MLHLLARYAKQHQLAVEPGFAPKSVHWALMFDPDGTFNELLDLRDTAAKGNPGRSFECCPDLTQGELIRGGKTRSHFLVDSAQVVALLDDPPEKIRRKHNFFVDLLEQASQAIPELADIATTLRDENTLDRIREKLNEQKAKPNDKVTIAIDDEYLLASEQWHDWWREYRSTLKSTKKSAKKAMPMLCFVSGEETLPCQTHPKITELRDVGGQSSGSSLVSFQEAAFTSYGLKKSANAAISQNMASAYRAGLNHLIREKGQRFSNAKIVYWYKQPVPPEWDPMPAITDPQAPIPSVRKEKQAERPIADILKSIEEGNHPPRLLKNQFYAMALSATGGRVMVRDWIEGQFEELVGNIKAWFEDLSITSRDGSGLANRPKFFAVLGSMVRDLRDLPAPFIAKMWHVAACREHIPLEALAKAVERTKVDIIQEKGFNHARMGIIKAYHVRNTKGGVSMTQYLNEDHPDVAYQCGRLMSVLADVQYRALGDVGAGIVQRFYAAASATPAMVLGRLIRTSQFHLNKLDTGLAKWFDRRIADIWARIKDNPPTTLTLEKQSLFAMGYYQQMAHDRATKSKKADQKETNNTTTEGETANE